MAIVLLAQDLKHNRTVAIKVLRPELAASLGAERFLREIQTAARLNHPHILSLHDSGEAAGFLYYVMPYVEGESLRQRLEREQQLPLDDALAITRQVAAALSHAHSRDVVHRDIKPENILLSGGEAVVADFGIARAISAAGGDRVTETGVPIGTPAYMSPEQAGGESQVDGRSDVYSLACVLYEMLVGAPPFTGPSAQAVMARHSLDPVPPVRTVRATVPPHFEHVITKAMAKIPADRYPTAADFVQALLAKPVGPPPSGIRVPARLLGSRVTLSLGAILLVAGAAWWAIAVPGGEALESGTGAAGRPLTADSQAFELYARGREYARSGRNTLAIEMLEAAVNRDPEFAAAYGELGMAHLRMQHWGDDRTASRLQLARTAIDRALELDPDLTEARVALGYYHLWGTLDYERALEAALRAQQGLRADDADVLLLRFGASRRLGRYSEAVEAGEELIQLTPGNASWRWEHASTLIGLRRYQEARRILDRAVTLFPENPGFYSLRWRVALLSAGDVEGARRELGRASTRLPSNALWRLEFEVNWLSRDYDAALGVLERVGAKTFREQEGEFPIELMYGLAHRLAGRAAVAQGFYRDALAALRQKVASKPADRWFHAWLAIGLAGAGEREAALVEAREAQRIAAASPDPWDNLKELLVDAYVMNGEVDTAVTMIGELLRSHYYFAITVPWLRVDPRLDPLRRTAGFKALVGET